MRDKTQLVALLRQRGQRLAFVLDPTDGLSRGEAAPQLRTLGVVTAADRPAPARGAAK